nr:hypothetical protein [Tanacetum cinerariifolium]
MSIKATSTKKTISGEATSPNEHMSVENRKPTIMSGTGRYLSTDMVVSDARPNKEEYRIRKDDTFMLEFDGTTSARKFLAKSVGFVRHPFELVELDSVQLIDNKYMIDVGGYITDVGRSIQTRTSSRTLNFHMANQRDQTIKFTLWGGLRDILIGNKTNSSTLILDDAHISALKATRYENSVVELIKEVMPLDFSKTRVGTLEKLLMWARNRRNDSVAFICQVRINNIKTRKGWNFPTCGEEKYKKGVSRNLGGDGVMPATKQYWFELGVSNETAHVVVVMFDETASELVKCSAYLLMQAKEESLDDGSNLSVALKNIIRSTHTLELKSHTYYEHRTFESFTCWKLHSFKG